jgi:type II secretory pathway pseudopilin PulG
MTMQRQAGFTILEALISLTIFLAVVAAVLSTYAPSRTIYARGERKADIQQNARLAMGEMARQVRMAGYFPENFSNPAPATPESDAVRIATDGELAIYGDADGSGESNLFYFCLDGTTLRRGSVPADTAYDCADGEALADNVVGLRFTYYNADGDPVPDPPTGGYQLDDQAPQTEPDLDDTTERATVRRVVVMLTTQLESPGRGPQVFTLTSDIGLRNFF